MKRSEFIKQTKEELMALIEAEDKELREYTMFLTAAIYDDALMNACMATAEERKDILIIIEKVKAVKALYDQYGLDWSQEDILKAFYEAEQKGIKRSELIEREFEDDIGEMTREQEYQIVADVIVKAIGIAEGLNQAQQSKVKDFLIQNPQLIESEIEGTEESLEEFQALLDNL